MSRCPVRMVSRMVCPLYFPNSLTAREIASIRPSSKFFFLHDSLPLPRGGNQAGFDCTHRATTALLFSPLREWARWFPTTNSLLTRPPTATQDMPVAQTRAFSFSHFALRGTARLSLTARIGGTQFHHARSASKKDGLAAPLPSLKPAVRPLQQARLVPLHNKRTCLMHLPSESVPTGGARFRLGPLIACHSLLSFS